jgi:hypothetical protein
MNKLLTNLLPLLLIFMLGGCRTLSSVKVHAPPQYEDGRPTDLHYENIARRTQEMAPEGRIPADAREAYLLALDELEARGIKVLPKAESGYEQWDQFTTTFPHTILVAPGWDELSYASRAATLWHELVHVREYEEYGELLMGLTYFTAEGRWAMEVQAYRETFRVLRILGRSEEDLRKSMHARADGLYEGYSLGSMPREYAVETAIDIWMLDSM